MVTHKQFSEAVGGCDIATFEIVKAQAMHKLEVIIENFGDEDGARLTDNYFLQLMIEELRSNRASETLFSIFTHSSNNRKCPATA